MTYWASGRDPPASVIDVQVGDDFAYDCAGNHYMRGWTRQGEGDGESGPSDYARKAWIGGLERRLVEENAHRENAMRCCDEWSRCQCGSSDVVIFGHECVGDCCDSEDKTGIDIRHHGTGPPHRSATRYPRLAASSKRPRRRKTPTGTAVAFATLAVPSLIPLASAAPAPAPPHLPRDPAHSSRGTISPSTRHPAPSISPSPSSPPPSHHATPTLSPPPTHESQEYGTAQGYWHWDRSSQAHRGTEGIDKRDGVKYLTSAEPPTAMPTATMNVPETALPYLLREGEDGTWTRAGEGWKLYGRQVGDAASTAPTDPQVTQTATWAVESALPPGWGSQSTRTDFYRVPLIVVAAVVLAVSIVVWIAVTAFKRRKAHRRQKRRAERLRRRALAAAGISEEDARTEEAQRKFEEKLDELQRERRMKKGEKFGKSGAGGEGSGRTRDREERTRLGQSKVRLWTSTLGLRRRRGARMGSAGRGGDEGDSAAPTPRPGSVVDPAAVEPKPEDPSIGVNTDTTARDSQDTDRSTPTVPSSHTAIESGLPSREQTTTEDSSESRDRMSSLGSSMRTRESPESDSRVRDTNQAHDGGATYFPPAYRPASVRSLPAASPSRYTADANLGEGSSSHGQTMHDNAVGVVRDVDRGGASEKVHAPGYYPAPSTADGEVALAVASRAEGKQRMPDLAPNEGNEEGDAYSAGVGSGAGAGIGAGARTRGHVATDDKRVLEQMRLAASAPPARLDGMAYDSTRSTFAALAATDGEAGPLGIGEGSSGPSAPHIETDQDGFETLPLDLGTPFAAPDATLHPLSQSPASSPRQPIHPDIPLPPSRPSARIRTLSMREEVEREVHEQLDELNLLPSAPPLGRALSHADAIDNVNVPSAPPEIADAQDVDADGAEVVGPSAPPMLEEDEDVEAEVDVGAVERHDDARGRREEEGQGGEEEEGHVREEPRVEGRFLPRYEP